MSDEQAEKATRFDAQTNDAIQFVSVTFHEDTPIDVHSVGRNHMGLVRIRAWPDGSPKQDTGHGQYYFPAGTTIDVPDYVASGVAKVAQ